MNEFRKCIECPKAIYIDGEYINTKKNAGKIIEFPELFVNFDSVLSIELYDINTGKLMIKLK